MPSTHRPAPASTTDGEQPDGAAAPTGAPTTATDVTPASEPVRGRTVSEDERAPAAPAAEQDPLELYRTRRERARRTRGAKFNGRLTWKLLEALEPLLEEPTPEQFKEALTRYPGSSRDPGMTVSLYYQLRVMDDTFTRAHWTYLTHHEDGGSTARTFVVIGNRLGRVALDETTGALIPGEQAEILFAREGRGGVDRANGKGDLLKSSQTSALKRLLGQIGPGRDVLEAPLPQDGAAGAPAAPDDVVKLRRYRPDLTAVAGAGDRKASELQVKMLCRIARTRGLPPSQVANLVRKAAGVAPVDYASEADAQEFLDVKLSERVIVFPFDLVTPLKHLLEQASPEAPVVPAPSPGEAQPGSGAVEEDVVAFDPSSAQAA
jgi:hypothetical protein